MSKLPARIGRNIKKLPELRAPKKRPLPMGAGSEQPTFNKRGRRGTLNRKAKWA